MWSSFLIAFRETLEAAFIVAIVLTLLAKLGAQQYRKLVWGAVAAGVAASALGAVLFAYLPTYFTHEAQEIFEAVVMIAAAILLATAVVWTWRLTYHQERLEGKLAGSLGLGKRVDIFLVVFLAILREGVELVLFLTTAGLRAQGSIALSVASGIAAAGVTGYLFTKNIAKLHLKKFITLANILLIAWAAYLLLSGAEELVEQLS